MCLLPDCSVLLLVVTVVIGACVLSLRLNSVSLALFDSSIWSWLIYFTVEATLVTG